MRFSGSLLLGHVSSRNHRGGEKASWHSYSMLQLPVLQKKRHSELPKERELRKKNRHGYFRSLC